MTQLARPPRARGAARRPGRGPCRGRRARGRRRRRTRRPRGRILAFVDEPPRRARTARAPRATSPARPRSSTRRRGSSCCSSTPRCSAGSSPAATPTATRNLAARRAPGGRGGDGHRRARAWSTPAVDLDVHVFHNAAGTSRPPPPRRPPPRAGPAGRRRRRQPRVRGRCAGCRVEDAGRAIDVDPRHASAMADARRSARSTGCVALRRDSRRRSGWRRRSCVVRGEGVDVLGDLLAVLGGDEQAGPRGRRAARRRRPPGRRGRCASRRATRVDDLAVLARRA